MTWLLKSIRLRHSLCVSVLGLAAACGGNTGADAPPPVPEETPTPNPTPDPAPDPSSGASPDPLTDPLPNPLPSETLPDDWFRAPGILDAGSSSVRTDFGFVLADDDGELLEAAVGIRFPINEGPAFPNSQRLGTGGQGFPAIGLPRPAPGQNSRANYGYPWKDNFCEYRQGVSNACPEGKGHYGQDIRPGTCENGKYLAVAPEDIRIRTVGTNHGVLGFGLDSGLLYSFLHLDRPLALHPRTGQRVRQGDILFEGEAIGRISSRTDPDPGCGSASQYCTTLHLHFEIWSGADGDALGSWRKGTNPLPPYTSLIASYIRMLDEEPGGADWAAEKPLVDDNLCKPPSLR